VDERAMPREGRSAGARRQGHSGTELKVRAARVLVEGQQVVRMVGLVEQRVELLGNHEHGPIIQCDRVQRHPH